MADKIDKLFTEYFSGELEKEISFRKFELRTAHSTDENIGGGRAENVNNEKTKVEGVIIKEDEDQELKMMQKRYKAVHDFIVDNDLELINMLDYYYDKRKKYVWKKVSGLVFKSERQCQNDRDRAKYRFLLKNTWIS
ncbi:RinA family protein [Fructobacillus cardui]|uniref:RinA family protein n=1 Tax=Fructobacillus cardui TaxID=2893170 RepID=UPI00200AAFA3|nr:RinA family protein [Fructobacillus cardui]MCK8628161.1 RinA family protein [Fructobacillus cardui]